MTRAVSLVAASICATALAGCAASFDPQPIEQVPFLERSESQASRGISVTAAVPSAEESKALFGVALYKRSIQPVWLEIENTTMGSVSFLPIGLDEDYLTPFEVSSMNNRVKAREQLEKHFFQNGIFAEIEPGEKHSGFLFTNLDEGTKAFNVDLIGNDESWRFTFFIAVPGLAIDHHEVDTHSLYEEDNVVDYSEAGPFIEALERLPCCTKDADGEAEGDPLNLVVIGSQADVYYSFIRAAWDETEVVTAASGFKTAMSFLTGGEYRYSPVSSLYVFGRKQDIALQKIRENIHERNHLRLWLAPMRYRGDPVWIGQISRDIGVRFTTKTITTHKIDADVDETREYLVENLAYAETLKGLAYVKGVGKAPPDAPRHNLTGDPYYTDGLRVVLWLSDSMTDLEDIEYVEWETPD